MRKLLILIGLCLTLSLSGQLLPGVIASQGGAAVDPEMISNGGFDDEDTDWAYTGTATFTGGLFTSSGESGYKVLAQTDGNMLSSIIGSTSYTLTFDLTVNTGSVYISIYNSATAVAYSATETLYDSSGTKTRTFTTPENVGVAGIELRMDIYGNFTLDNISLKKD